MQKFISIAFKAVYKIIRFLIKRIEWLLCRIIFYVYNVQCKPFKTNGLPFISVARGGKCIIDEGFTMNNGLKGNPIGRPQPCVIFVDYGATLIIGKNVGISATALVAHSSITIGDNVKIGGGVCIYDTDFHSLDAALRTNVILDRENKTKRPVYIGNNVFIGAHSTILKGVNIGDNSIIGACSVVTKSIPTNEIWAGNPAQFIKKIAAND